MSKQGPNNPGTVANDTSFGSSSWINVNNAKVSDNIYASNLINNTTASALQDAVVKIVKSDGSIGTTDKADTSTNWTGTDTYFSYGSYSDLWGESWTDTDINNTNFGVVIAAKDITNNSNYLKATNFGFSIPSGATINGILVEIEKKRVTTSFAKGTRVKTKKGEKNIEILKSGDLITTIFRGKLVEDEVVAVHSTTNRDTLKLKTDIGDIITTNSHPFKRGNRWVKACNLKVGDIIVCIIDNKITSTKVLENIKFGNREVFNITTKKYHTYIANNYFVHNIVLGSSSAYIDNIRITVDFTTSAPVSWLTA